MERRLYLMGMNVLWSSLAGLCYGFWPLAMNRAKLDPFATAIVFGTGTLLFMLPMAYFAKWGDVTGGALRFAALACAFSAVGTFCFSRMLATSSIQETAQMFLVMIVVQVAVPAAILLYKGVSLRQAAGLAAVALAVFLLSKP